MNQNKSEAAYQLPQESIERMCRKVDHTYSTVSTAVLYNLTICVVRQGFVVFSILFPYVFVPLTNGIPSSWHIVFLLITSSIDCAALMAQACLCRLIISQQTAYDQLKSQLRAGTVSTHQTYLSVYSTLKAYKYCNRSNASYYHSLRILHGLLSFIWFGIPVLYHLQETHVLKVGIVWLYLFSIYYTTYEVDWYLIQSSNGPYIELTHCKKLYPKELKDRFISECVRFYQMTNVLTICALAIILFYTYGRYIFNITTSICLLLHLLLLILERRMQEKLFDLNLQTLDYKQFTPFLILQSVTNNTTYAGLNQSIRISFVFNFFAYYLCSEDIFQQAAFLLFCLLVFWWYICKVSALEHSKLYILKSKKYQLNPPSADQSVSKTDIIEQNRAQCSICLVDYLQNVKVMQLPCSDHHIFHQICFKKWTKSNKSCPLCRISLERYIIL